MTRAASRGEWRAAGTLPVARIAVDVPLAHLDRPFDYRVPAHLDDQAVPGVRVRVRFAGRLVDGFLLERVEESAHGGKLAWVDRIVSAEPVLSAQVARLCRAVADRYAGLFADVVRLAVPPRHARVEGESPRPRPRPVDAAPADPAPADSAAAGPAPAGSASAGLPADGWARYPRGPAFLDALRGGRAAHAVWQALPGEPWPQRLADAAAATVATGRGVLVVVPDQHDLDAVHAALAGGLGPDAVVALSAELGPAERYRRWLAVRRGQVQVVVGTRSAAFAPVADVGLLVVWDDGDDLHAEPRAPYPHVRDVLVLRAHIDGAALLLGGFARTAEAHLLVREGWAAAIVAHRGTVRERAPRVTAIGESDTQLARDPDARAARVPAVAFEAARQALGAGRPVLVQVPRAGYLPWLSCANCRETARCRHCAGPLGLPRGGPAGDPGLPTCRWCGRGEPAFRCGGCGGRRLRAGVVGARRTAEELGRAFPGRAVRSSGGGAPALPGITGKPEIVVATPGAEPRAEAGYGAALLLDGWAMLSRPDLRVAEETLRRWLAAAALVVPHTEGGRVVVVADSALPVVQALVRWDPAGFAEDELAARIEVGFPPAVRMASVEGVPDAVAGVVDEVLAGAPGVEVLGPVEIDPAAGPPAPDAGPRERALLRVPRVEGRALARALAAAQASRSARKATDPVRIQLDPTEIG